MISDRGLLVIMLCLFVILLTSSTMDVAKYQKVLSSFSNHPNKPSESHTLFQAGVTRMGHLAEQPVIVLDGYGETTESISIDEQGDYYELAAELQKLVDEQVADASVRMVQDAVMVRFRDDLFFEKNKAQIKTESYDVLDLFADVLLKYAPLKIDILVHTDNEVVNTVQYPNSWYLTSAKAVSLGLYLQEMNGIPHQLVTAYGEGKYTPLVSNDTEENKSRNRRVEIYIRTK